MPVHHRARSAAAKAATHPRQKAVDQEQPSARLKPMPIRSPAMADKIINDFILNQLFSNPVAIGGTIAGMTVSSTFIGGFLRKQHRRLRAPKFTRNFLPGAKKADGTFCA
jgi:hypothetical protein